MQRDAVFRLLHRQKPLAASIKSTNENRLAWVGIYPLNLEERLTQEFLRNHGVKEIPSSGRAYHVRRFEVQRQLIEADVWFGETELENASSAIVFSDEDLVKELEKLGVTIERLETHYDSNYPI